MRWWLPLVALAVGCDRGTGEASRLLQASDYTPGSGMELAYVPPGDGYAVPLWIVVTTGQWAFKAGDDVDTASELAVLSVSDVGSLVIDGDEVLPDPFSEGDATDAANIGEIEALETWYGTFPTAVRVTIHQGRLAGEAAFAEGVGPVLLTFDGNPWELAGYWPPD